jgi:hypothetical protein
MSCYGRPIETPNISGEPYTELEHHAGMLLAHQ